MRLEAVVKIKNLNHFYGKGSYKNQILHNVNFQLLSGELVLLRGPSGSGKSTLLTLIGGLRSVQEGSLKVLGHELNGASKEDLVQTRRQIGYVFQHFNLLNCLTALQNVKISAELTINSKHKAKARAKEILIATGLQHRLNHYPQQLSGGEKQRVAIACALVNYPKLVLADEPTAALDSHLGREIMTLLQQLTKEYNSSVLLVTHDNRILDFADRLVQIEDGLLSSQT